MVKVELLKEEMRPLYTLTPTEQLALFEERVKELLNQLPAERLSNRAFLEMMKRKGWRRLNRLRRKFERELSLNERKLIYGAFKKIFQRLEWVLEAGSEKEIEIKVWIASSIDYLCEITALVEERRVERDGK